MNSDGQLGAPTTETCTVGSIVSPCSTTPVMVSGGLTFATVSPGTYHTCGVTTDGVGYCWGGNGTGELGDGTTDGHPSPVRISGGLIFVSVSAGNLHTCGATTSGAAY